CGAGGAHHVGPQPVRNPYLRSACHARRARAGFVDTTPQVTEEPSRAAAANAKGSDSGSRRQRRCFGYPVRKTFYQQGLSQEARGVFSRIRGVLYLGAGGGILFVGALEVFDLAVLEMPDSRRDLF